MSKRLRFLFLIEENEEFKLKYVLDWVLWWIKLVYLLYLNRNKKNFKENF